MSSFKDLEEYYRRIMVKLIKEAGTGIIKEVVKRQALSAELNLEYAESLRKLIEEDYEIILKPLESILGESFERFKKGEDIGKIISESITSLIARGISSLFIRPVPEIVGHIHSVNSFIKSVPNKIAEELSKQGIPVHYLEPITLSQQPDIFSLAIALREARNVMNRSVAILKGLVDASKET
jgi:hypothetical protein